MECFNCFCAIKGNYHRMDKLCFCSRPCVQAHFVEGLEQNLENNIQSSKRPHHPYFIKVFNAEALLIKAILKRTKTEHLLRMRKIVLDAMVDMMEWSIGEGDDGTVDNGAYLRLSNATKDRLASFDAFIKIFGSP